MKVLSVNVGMPRLVEHRGEPVATGIFKEPVFSRVRVDQFNLEGDGQADLRVHGGPAKSVYVYPAEHYEYWRNELRDVELPWGVFGENLTTEGIVEREVRPGDRLRIGSAEFAVTGPRYPCYKLGIRFMHLLADDPFRGGLLGQDGINIIRQFARSGRSGFYLTVTKTGELGSGDEIEFESAGRDGSTIAEIVRKKSAKSE